MFEELEKYIWGLYNWFNKKKSIKFGKVGKYWLEVEYYDNGGAWIGMGKDIILLEALVSKDKIEYINISEWAEFKKMFNETKNEVIKCSKSG